MKPYQGTDTGSLTRPSALVPLAVILIGMTVGSFVFLHSTVGGAVAVIGGLYLWRWNHTMRGAATLQNLEPGETLRAAYPAQVVGLDLFRPLRFTAVRVTDRRVSCAGGGAPASMLLSDIEILTPARYGWNRRCLRIATSNARVTLAFESTDARDAVLSACTSGMRT